MFKWLKSDPIKKLGQKYNTKLKEAMEAQRKGDMRLFAELTEEAESIHKSLEALKTGSGSSDS